MAEFALAAQLYKSIREGEKAVQIADATFETLLSNYRLGPRTQETYRVLTIRAEEQDRIRAQGEWTKWYYEQVDMQGGLLCLTCFFSLPCYLEFAYETGPWKGYEAWRAKHPRQASWNIEKRIPTGERPAREQPVKSMTMSDRIDAPGSDSQALGASDLPSLVAALASSGDASVSDYQALIAAYMKLASSSGQLIECAGAMEEPTGESMTSEDFHQELSIDC